jgi:hypothetical protein
MPGQKKVLRGTLHPLAQPIHLSSHPFGSGRKAIAPVLQVAESQLGPWGRALAAGAVPSCKMGSAVPRSFDRRHPGWCPTAFSRRFRCEESQRPVVRTVARMSVGGTVSGGLLPRQVPGFQFPPARSQTPPIVRPIRSHADLGNGGQPWVVLPLQWTTGANGYDGRLHVRIPSYR